MNTKRKPPVRVQRIDPTAPAARDEGPRLIPLKRDRRSQVAESRRLLELADIVLDTGKKKPKRKRAS